MEDAGRAREGVCTSVCGTEEDIVTTAERLLESIPSFSKSASFASSSASSRLLASLIEPDALSESDDANRLRQVVRRMSLGTALVNPNALDSIIVARRASVAAARRASTCSATGNVRPLSSSRRASVAAARRASTCSAVHNVQSKASARRTSAAAARRASTCSATLKGQRSPAKSDHASTWFAVHRAPIAPVRSGSKSSAIASVESELPRLLNSSRSPSLTEVTQLEPNESRLASAFQRLVRHAAFQAGTIFALLAALFLPDVWVLADMSDNTELDVLLLFALVVFVLELLARSVGFAKTYCGSFFFWTDLVGAASVLLDFSFISLFAPGNELSDGAIVMRAARIAKLGARAGRFMKLMRLLRFLPGFRETSAIHTHVISPKFTKALSTRVSCLIIVMVILMPLFSIWSYPEHDWSMVLWLQILERAREERRLAEQIDQLQLFYKSMNYFPYRLAAHETLPLCCDRVAPKRPWNSVRISSEHFDCDFNFTVPAQISAATNIALTIFVMGLMSGIPLILARSVADIAMKPLERLLAQVRAAASCFEASELATDLATRADVDSDEFASESHVVDLNDSNQQLSIQDATLIVERILVRLAEVGQLISPAEDEEPSDEMDKAILASYPELQAHHRGWSITPHEADSKCQDNSDEARCQFLQNLGLSLDLVDSWRLNPLEIDKVRCKGASSYFLSQINHGIQIDPVVVNDFVQAAEGGYFQIPYHNWFHAVDVTHAIYLLLRENNASQFLPSLERLALLVSAVCHDLGHLGLSNLFLAETAHEIALHYNDQSPLENMHCARLFQLITKPAYNIFEPLLAVQRQQARTVCVEAILHTDNVHHFKIIKDVDYLYERNSEVFAKHDSQLLTSDCGDAILDVLRQREARVLFWRLFLHVADTSNPTKFFRIAQVWARKAFEEMFCQGDSERELGIPVQPLNDRERVNIGLAQIGFIERVAAPLHCSAARVLPALEPCVNEMLQNSRNWAEVWLEETHPRPDEDENIAMDKRLAQLEARCLASA